MNIKNMRKFRMNFNKPLHIKVRMIGSWRPFNLVSFTVQHSGVSIQQSAVGMYMLLVIANVFGATFIKLHPFKNWAGRQQRRRDETLWHLFLNILLTQIKSYVVKNISRIGESIKNNLPTFRIFFIYSIWLLNIIIFC